MSQTALRDASIFLPVAEAIRLGGGPAKLAAAISAITPDQSIKGNAVRQWPLKRHGMVPIRRVRALSRVLNVSKSALRPAIFGQLES
jgi:hypothetical protein